MAKAQTRRGRGTLAERVAAYMERHAMLRPGERIAVAVSSGADSVALLLLMLELREQFGLVVSVTHVHHGLRGFAADGDEQFARDLATKHGLAFHSARVDVAAKAKEEKLNLEDAGRRARYEFFAQLVNTKEVNGVAVGHTADDQAETVLAHILRGTGLAGLGGIHPKRVNIVRPLLGIRRGELRKYLMENGQTWREDATNEDTARVRARIRKTLLPLLQQEFSSNAVEHLTSLAERAQENEAFWDEMVGEYFTQVVARIAGGAALEVPAKDLLQPRGKHNGERFRALTSRLVLRILRQVKKTPGEFSARHVDSVFQLAAGKSGNSLCLPGGVEIRRERETLIFCGVSGTTEENPHRVLPKKRSVTYEHKIETIDESAEVWIPELTCKFRFVSIDCPERSSQTIYSCQILDRDALNFPLVLRNRRPGDKLHAKGRKNTHKLKELLSQKHISGWKREGWPVLVSGDTLVWARGFPVAAQFAAGEKTVHGIAIVEVPANEKS
jgi:tRNA(Ile)-lysidine synthase